MRATFTAIAATLTISAAPLHAQRNEQDKAVESAAQKNLEAIARSDYLYAAKTTDPAELRRNRAAFDSLLRADTTNYIARRLFRLDSTSQLRRLSDVAFNAGLMTFWFGLRRGSQRTPEIMGVEIAGTVHKNSDSAYVVYKWIFPPNVPPLRSYTATGMVRCGKEWCAQMAGDFTPLVELLKEPMVPIPPR